MAVLATLDTTAHIQHIILRTVLTEINTSTGSWVPWLPAVTVTPTNMTFGVY